uniref:Zinc finger, CCHC-type, retrotransposon Gag domain protein n=1 Tax=Tanacetum cinerariifolium TaxID=118510 RepID=A0A699U9K2_TANCI|nr:hypothetical protein [Tanacetum cinerariifolium]
MVSWTLFSPSVHTLCMFPHKGSRCVFSDFPRGVTIMVSEPGYETVGSKDLTCEDWNALQTLLPQIRVEIREEFRTSSGPSDTGGNPPPVTIHTWLESFNKQKPHSFEKATSLVDAEN